MRCRQCTLSSNPTTLESNKSDLTHSRLNQAANYLSEGYEDEQSQRSKYVLV
jgi:hypothetical protein